MTWPTCAARLGARSSCRCGCTGAAPSPVFCLEDPGHAALAVPDALREAGRPQDLIGYLDRDALIAVWPELHLPKGVRQAWEEHRPQLRAASPRTAQYRSVTGTGRLPRSHQPQRRILADDGLAVGVVIERRTCPC